MRLHTNTLTTSDIYTALRNGKDADNISRMVSFRDPLVQRNSRKRDHAFEVQLVWLGRKVRGDGRRFKNTGTSGADATYAATYDEWGWFIAALFAMDPAMIFGHYNGIADYNRQTNGKYILPASNA